MDNEQKYALQNDVERKASICHCGVPNTSSTWSPCFAGPKTSTRTLKVRTSLYFIFSNCREWGTMGMEG